MRSSNVLPVLHILTPDQTALACTSLAGSIVTPLVWEYGGAIVVRTVNSSLTSFVKVLVNWQLSSVDYVRSFVDCSCENGNVLPCLLFVFYQLNTEHRLLRCELSVRNVFSTDSVRAFKGTPCVMFCLWNLGVDSIIQVLSLEKQNMFAESRRMVFFMWRW